MCPAWGDGQNSGESEVLQVFNHEHSSIYFDSTAVENNMAEGFSALCLCQTSRAFSKIIPILDLIESQPYLILVMGNRKS